MSFSKVETETHGDQLEAIKWDDAAWQFLILS